jgi:hypothetical protein
MFSTYLVMVIDLGEDVLKENIKSCGRVGDKNMETTSRIYWNHVEP